MKLIMKGRANHVKYGGPAPLSATRRLGNTKDMPIKERNVVVSVSKVDPSIYLARWRGAVGEAIVIADV